MLAISSGHRYFIYGEPIHINSSFYSLAGIVSDQLKADPLTGDVYIFLNRRCTQIKLLLWEGDGFGIYHKKLEKGTFELPATGSQAHIQITHHQLLHLLQGITLSSVHYRRRYDQNKVVC